MFIAEKINLLPGFVAARQRARRLMALATLTAVGVGIGGSLVWVQQGVVIRGLDRDLAAQSAANAVVATEVARLADLEVLQSQVLTKTALLQQATADEVRWSVLMADLQAIVPNDTWLIGFSGTVEPNASLGTWGRIEFQGVTFSHPDVADWLDSLEKVPGFVAPYFSVSSKAKLGDRTVVQFSSSVELTEIALRRTQPGAERRP
ncbi:MAG: PilN domain-containing protein [Actinomycetota bacterium]